MSQTSVWLKHVAQFSNLILQFCSCVRCRQLKQS